MIPHSNNVLTFDNAKKAVDDFNAAGKVLKENGITLFVTMPTVMSF